MTVIAVIPARYQSTRFVGKPLQKILDKPMIQHVYEQVSRMPLFQKSQNQIIVATDTEKIAKVVQDFGGNVEMTSKDCESGTDRIVEVVARYSVDWVLNVQGDEPLICPKDLQNLVEETLEKAQTFSKADTQLTGTLMYPIQSDEELHNPHVVKVVTSLQNRALYFSRSAIPFQRESTKQLYKHIGVYFYHKNVLQQYTKWKPSPLEQTEKLEQLRLLENDYNIFCTIATQDTVGVDTPQDLKNVEEYLQKAINN